MQRRKNSVIRFTARIDGEYAFHHTLGVWYKNNVKIKRKKNALFNGQIVRKTNKTEAKAWMCCLVCSPIVSLQSLTLANLFGLQTERRIMSQMDWSEREVGYGGWKAPEICLKSQHICQRIWFYVHNRVVRFVLGNRVV